MTPALAAPSRGRRIGRWWAAWAAGLATMAVTVMAFHPLAFRPFILVGPAAFLFLLAREREGRFRPIWWGGMSAWGAGLLAWIGSLAGAEAAGKVGWLLVSGIFLLMSWPFGFLLRRALRRGLPLVVAAPLVMTGFDAFRHLSSRGLTWHDLGYALADWNLLIQVADLASVYPVSALVWLANGLIADLLLARREGRRPGRGLRLVAPLVLGLLLGLALGYGHVRREALERELRPGPLLAGLQTAIPQAEKLDEGESAYEHRHRIGLELLRAAAAEAAPDLVVWPETSFFPIDESTRSSPRGVPLRLWLRAPRRSTGKSVTTEFAEILGADFARCRFLIGALEKTDLPVGAYDEAGKGLRERNGAFLLEPRAGAGGPELERVAEAFKIKLVPFGEYIPFPGIRFMRDRLHRFMLETAGYLPAMTAGDRVAVWKLGDQASAPRATVNVCYEVVFPEIFRAGRAAGADLAINVSNDAWYDDSAERELVHAQVRFRAIENRFAIFRVSNTGLSVSMDPLGRARRVLERDRRSTLLDRPALGLRPPPALRWTARLEWLVLIVAALSAFLPRVRKSP